MLLLWLAIFLSIHGIRTCSGQDGLDRTGIDCNQVNGAFTQGVGPVEVDQQPANGERKLTSGVLTYNKGESKCTGPSWSTLLNTNVRPVC